MIDLDIREEPQWMLTNTSIGPFHGLRKNSPVVLLRIRRLHKLHDPYAVISIVSRWLWWLVCLFGS